MKRYYIDFEQQYTEAKFYFTDNHNLINVVGRLYGPFLSVAKAKAYLTEVIDGEIISRRALKNKIRYTKPEEL